MGTERSLAVYLALVVGAVLLVGIAAIASVSGGSWFGTDSSSITGFAVMQSPECPLQASQYNSRNYDYTVQGITYRIKAQLNNEGAVLTVNGEATPRLRTGEEATLSDGTHIRVKSLMRGLWGKRVTFCLTPPSGVPPSSGITCPIDGVEFAPSNPDFLGLVGNELQIALYYQADIPYLAQKYEEAGVKKVRIVLNWKNIENTNDAFNWGYADKLIGDMAQAGIQPVAIIANTPQWASSCPNETHYQSCIAANLDEYRAFVRTAVRRYGPAGTNTINDWEIRVEANTNHGLLTKEQYVQQELNPAYAVIKQEDPDAKVWGPEVVFHQNNGAYPNGGAYQWTTYTIANGEYDVFSIHQFYNLTTGYEHTMRVRQLLDAAGQQEVPLAVSAMTSEFASARTEQAQATALRDLYACVSSAGADYAMWFSGTEWPDYQNDTNKFGIFDYDFTISERVKPKLAYYALKELGDSMEPPSSMCGSGQQDLRYNAGAGALTWNAAGAYASDGTSSLWTSGVAGQCCDQGTQCSFPTGCQNNGAFMGNYSYVCASNQEQGVIFGCTEEAVQNDGEKLLGNAAYCCSKYSADYNQGNLYFHALPGQRRFGSATLDEKREITRPGYDACTDGSDNDCDGLVDAQDPDCGGADSQVRGVFFNPTITLNGQGLGTEITEHYFEGTVRTQFQSELRKYKQKTGANAVLLWAWPHMGMSWPLAESYQLDGLAAMIKDANAEGLDVILAIGHPYIVPQSRMIAEGTDGVCGHHAGDVVGGLTLLWDMAPCTEDVITPSKAWFSSVIDGLEARAVTKDDIAYLMVGGHFKLFYGGEFNMLRGSNKHLSDAQAYLRAMNPYLHSITDIPVGISLLPKTLRPETPGPEDFLHNLFDAVPIEQWDVLDITWSPYVDPAEIDGFQTIVDTVPEKIIVSDFKTDIAYENGMTRAAAITNGIDYAEQHGLKGYWFFVYRDMSGAYGLMDAQGTWREDIVQAFSRGHECDGTANDVDCEPQEELHQMPVACVPGEEPARVTQDFLGMGMKEAGAWLNTLSGTPYVEWMTERLDSAGVQSAIISAQPDIIENLTVRGITPIVAITPPTRTDGSAPTAPYSAADIATWENDVRTLVRTYGTSGNNQVHDWKFHNEPNGRTYWENTREYYTIFLNRFYAIVKQEDPTARVWAPGVVYHENNYPTAPGYPYGQPDEWVNHVIANGQFDVFSVHFYLADPVAMRDTIRSIRTRLDAAGHQGTPIAVTEFNAWDIWSPIEGDCPYAQMTEQEQATAFARYSACVADGGADYAYWFTATDRPNKKADGTLRYPNCGENGQIRTGVFTRDPVAEKLSYSALRDIGVALETATVETPPVERDPVKGMFFNPETYTQSGASPGNRWIFHYFTPGIREQAKAEMRAIKQKTGATHLVIPATAFSQFSWPTPTTDEIDKMAAVINDANAEGFKVILGMGHPYIVPKSHLQPSAGLNPVCGHTTGQVVNGYTLFWDIPDCPENNIALSKEWYRVAITGIEQRLNDKQGIAYIQLSGHMGVPFYTEMNMFHDGDPYLSDAQAYVGAMVPYLHSITKIPIGALLLSTNLDPAVENHPEQFLPNVFEAVPLEQWDYLDITWSPHVRMEDIIGMDHVLASASQKIVLSDGKPHIMTSMTQAQVIKRQVDVAQQYHLGGFWYWTYKDSPNNPEFIGLRQYGFAGAAAGGWKQDAVNAFRGIAPQPSSATLTANPNPCVIAANSKACATTISWSSTGVTQPYVRVNVNGVLFACAPANTPGSKVTSVIAEGETTIITLHEASSCAIHGAIGSTLTKLEVRGIRVSTKPAIKPAVTPVVEAEPVDEKVETTAVKSDDLTARKG